MSCGAVRRAFVTATTGRGTAEWCVAEGMGQGAARVDGDVAPRYSLPMSCASASSSRLSPRLEPQEPEPGASPVTSHCHVLLLSCLSLVVIGAGVWLVSPASRYREEYARVKNGWHVGSTQRVEITLVKKDKAGLSCASDQSIAGLRCGFGRDHRPIGALQADDPNVLQPFNTVKNELLLGAGLWRSPELARDLPDHRFTVVCNYTVKGVLRSGAIRFGVAGSFSRLGRTATAGTLTDCKIPK